MSDNITQLLKSIFGDAFEWRIAVCDDGTFCVSESDAELTDRAETFDTLRDAKTWCEEQEERLQRLCGYEQSEESA